MDLNEIAAFLKVVQLGSFSKAARALHMPNSTVSSRVASLEKRLGLTLIQRTTRTLVVTSAGQTYFEYCSRGLREMQAAEAAVGQDRAEPHGALRLTAPVEVGTSILPELLTSFAAKHSRVRPEVVLTDRRVDLLGEGIDLAIRAGELTDSTLVVKRLASAAFGAFAAPKFAAKHVPSSAPGDMTACPTLAFAPMGDGPWTLEGPTGEVRVTGEVRMILNDLNLLKRLTMDGLGLSLLPTFFCTAEVRSNGLVRVWPAWATRSRPLQFVYPAQRFVSRNVSAFIEHCTEPLRAALRDPDAS